MKVKKKHIYIGIGITLMIMLAIVISGLSWDENTTADERVGHYKEEFPAKVAETPEPSNLKPDSNVSSLEDQFETIANLIPLVIIITITVTLAIPIIRIFSPGRDFGDI